MPMRYTADGKCEVDLSDEQYGIYNDSIPEWCAHLFEGTNLWFCSCGAELDFAGLARPTKWTERLFTLRGSSSLHRCEPLPPAPFCKFTRANTSQERLSESQVDTTERPDYWDYA